MEEMISINIRSRLKALKISNFFKKFLFKSNMLLNKLFHRVFDLLLNKQMRYLCINGYENII